MSAQTIEVPWAAYKSLAEWAIEQANRAKAADAKLTAARELAERSRTNEGAIQSGDPVRPVLMFGIVKTSDLLAILDGPEPQTERDVPALGGRSEFVEANRLADEHIRICDLLVEVFTTAEHGLHVRSLLAWWSDPHRLLDNRSPAEAYRTGDAEGIRRVADSLDRLLNGVFE